MALTKDAPVGKHQRELVSQVKVKLNPANFSKTHVFHVKMFDSTRQFFSQSEGREDPDLNSSPTYNRQWYQLIISSCSTKVCMS